MIFHGGGLDKAIEKYGGDKSEWLDLSTGINPNPYPVYGVDNLAWSRLPDIAAMENLICAARKYYGVSKSQELVAANGTQAIIEILPNVLSAKRVGIVSPTYNEHANVWSKAGAEIVEIAHGANIPSDIEILVLVNPNNPTTETLDQDAVAALANQMKTQGGHLIVDEAFCDPNPEISIASEALDNVIVLKSFGKFFGLAGLRLGFAIAPPDLVQKISQQIGPWSVSGPALQIGARAFADEDWINYTKTALNALSVKQAQMLRDLGMNVCGTNPLFIYVEDARAKKIYEALAKAHILVRPFPECCNFLRFGICADRKQIERLKTALETIL